MQRIQPAALPLPEPRSVETIAHHLRRHSPHLSIDPLHPGGVLNTMRSMNRLIKMNEGDSFVKVLGKGRPRF